MCYRFKLKHSLQKKKLKMKKTNQKEKERDRDEEATILSELIWKMYVLLHHFH